MRVFNRRTGWEHLKDNPVAFFEQVLKLRLPEYHKRVVNDVAMGRRSRLGLVWRPEQPVIDVCTLALGVALWRAATQNRTALIWGGRRTQAYLWMDHCVSILAAADYSFRRDYALHRDTEDWSKPWGITTSNGAWALRYDGAMRADAVKAAHILDNHVDVFVADFDWMDSIQMQDAMRFSDMNDCLMTLVTGGHYE